MKLDQSTAWNRMERRKEKERKAAHWFRNDEKDQHDFPIFCPYTANNELCTVGGELRTT